jgi:hypothetical protein
MPSVFRFSVPRPRTVPQCGVCHKPVDAFIRDLRLSSCSFTVLCHGQREVVEVPEAMARLLTRDPHARVTLGVAFDRPLLSEGGVES